MDNIIFKQWENKYDKILFITSNPGYGKTYLLKSIIKDYESITIETISKNTPEQIYKIFNTKNINAMINNINKKKLLYIDDNISNNINLFKTIGKSNNPIIITMSNPISSKFLKYINTQYHIIIKNKMNDIINYNQDIYYYNNLEIINNLINKKYKISDCNLLYDESIILLNLLQNTKDIYLLDNFYKSYCSYNKSNYDDVYHQIYYLIIPMILINNTDKQLNNINKYTNYISRMIVSKQLKNKKGTIMEYINYISLL